MRKMIDFYVECREGQISESSSLHIKDILNRAFDILENDYDVKMSEYRIENLDGTVLMRWLNSMKKNHKPASINNYVCIMNPFLRWAATMTKGETPYMAMDCSKVLKCVKLPSYDELPPEERPKDKYYSNAQVEELLSYRYKGQCNEAAARDDAIIALILGSGLRVSELCSLKVSDITGRPQGSVYVKRKGGHYKTVDVADFVYDYINRYLNLRADGHPDDSPLFITTHGVPVCRNAVYKSLSRRQSALGLAEGPHALRHTFISAAEKVGGGAVARDLANHRSLVITNRYDHSSAEERRAAVNALPWSI